MRSTFVVTLACLFWAGSLRAQEDDEVPDRFSIVPFGAVFYAPETNVVFAAAALAHFRLDEAEGRRDSKALLTLAYTIENRYLANLQGDFYLDEDRWLVAYELEHSYFPGRFYGIGNDTSLDDEERYLRRSYVIELTPRVRVAPSLYAGPSARAKYYDMLEVEAGGLLDTAGVVGAGGGLDVGLGASALWDTRDVTLNPRRGAYAELEIHRSASYTLSEFTFTSATLDVRGYLSTVARQVLALQGYLGVASGEPPFFMLERFGGSSLMRGHYAGRYRDRNVTVLQAEYRVPVWWRFGVVGFAGVGRVDRSLSDFEPAGTHLSAGGGLRVMLERSSRINVRLDAAWGEDDYGLYLALGEAF